MKLIKKADEKLGRLVAWWMNLPTEDDMERIRLMTGVELAENPRPTKKSKSSNLKDGKVNSGPEKMFKNIDFRRKVFINVKDDFGGYCKHRVAGEYFREILLKSKLKQAMKAKTRLVIDFREVEYDEDFIESAFGELVDHYGPKLLYYIDIVRNSEIESKVIDLVLKEK